MRDAANRLVAEYATRDRNGDPTALAALVALRERTIAVDLSNLEAQLAATREFVDDRTRLHGERDV